jgi:hypothetical protein
VERIDDITFDVILDMNAATALTVLSQDCFAQIAPRGAVSYQRACERPIHARPWPTGIGVPCPDGQTCALT